MMGLVQARVRLSLLDRSAGRDSIVTVRRAKTQSAEVVVAGLVFSPHRGVRLVLTRADHENSRP